MAVESVETLVIGGGQAGLAMSAHLAKAGRPHLVVERARIAERWRTERWDSLVANGPAWHDRFPDATFADIDPDSFAGKDRIVRYFEEFAAQIAAPIRCGVEVTSLTRGAGGAGFRAVTQDGVIEARNVVVATGPFQKPVFPAMIPESAGVMQIHSNHYRNPGQLPEGAVLVIGAGSSGSQIADELLRSGREVWLSVGPHDRPPRAYRGRDFVWWLGALGKWDARAQTPGMEHVTIAVSGAQGGHTVDFRDLGNRGMRLVGRTAGFAEGRLSFAPDLAETIARGDANYLSVLDEADAHVARERLDLPEEPEARVMQPMPACVTEPVLSLDLKAAGISAVIWATGYQLDFGWIGFDIFDAQGRPRHQQGITEVPGLCFLGLPWLTRRASPFIWGVWHDAAHLAAHLEARLAAETV
ncbi:FAD-dependent oxidoreductase [Tabrizicola sp. TH137]|uniref:flavin-containing monooxygenase n=1 Tax=Tabrizicola sp. TH137 TaxID=2067452 RepID=UPI000C7AFFBB|nr:NAD(P)/FAD-dependent oxidoreductase [Tabrizicola sp. TH137]PLL13037.1 FAD-dependent oxidoreductase [Tabrizicola sp. TH137]